MPARPPRSRSWWTRVAGSRSQIAGRGAPKANVPLGARRCRSCRRARMARSPAPAATDRLAPTRCAQRPAARQRLRPDAENFGAEVLRHRSLKYRQRSDSFRLDVRRLDDRPPFLDLGLLISPQRLRRLPLARRDFEPLFGEGFMYGWIAQRVQGRRVELADDVLRRAPGRK